MSDAVSVDSGPESEYDFNDLEEGKEGEGRSNSGIRKKFGGGNLSGRKPAGQLRTVIKQGDPNKPPIMIKNIS
jgi:hypothetical protein